MRTEGGRKGGREEGVDSSTLSAVSIEYKFPPLELSERPAVHVCVRNWEEATTTTWWSNQMLWLSPMAYMSDIHVELFYTVWGVRLFQRFSRRSIGRLTGTAAPMYAAQANNGMWNSQKIFYKTSGITWRPKLYESPRLLPKSSWALGQRKNSV